MCLQGLKTLGEDIAIESTIMIVVLRASSEMMYLCTIKAHSIYGLQVWIVLKSISGV